MSVPVTYRDFLLGGDFHAGDIQGSNGAVTGLVQATLDSEGKPVLAVAGGTGTTSGYITSAATFKQWYRDVGLPTNTTYVSSLILYNNGKGGFVNRWGAQGEQWNLTETAYYCGNVGEEMLDATGKAMPCTSKYQDNSPTECMTKLAAGETMLKCYVDGNTYKATFLASKVDGNPLFFPVDNVPGMITPTSAYAAAATPPMYSTIWTDQAGLHNFSFTSEVRYWFSYSTSKQYTLDFTGDDDVWVFVNRKLAVDIGGIHTPVEGQIVLNATGGGTVTITPTAGAACKTEGVLATCTGTQSKVDLGMSNNGVYEIVVFQAERAWKGSTYKLTLSGFNDLPSACGPICGDGKVAPGEQCDNGKDNVGGYNKGLIRNNLITHCACDWV
jgi:fibro-slime domain-containing protein